jgi:uncharacterized protein (TIGR00369 family)
VPPDSPPPGFVLLESSPFVEQVGPIYRTSEGRLGVRVLPTHTNTMGSVHGGFLMTVVDIAAGQGARRAIGAGSVVRTVSTTIDFLATAGVGSWLEAELTVDRIGRRTVFTSCRVTSGETVVARATAVLMRG